MSYIPLEQLNVYKLSREYSKECWFIYNNMDWQTKKVIGDQMMSSVDSIGANTAEGYGRFHYLDKIKFYYNARGSLFESKHWINLLFERNIIDKEKHTKLIGLYIEISKCLNGLISSNYQKKNPS